MKNGVMPLHNEYFYNEESGKKRMQEVVSLLLSDYLIMQQFTKKVKRQIRELISLVYQRELQLALENLDQHFEQ